LHFEQHTTDIILLKSKPYVFFSKPYLGEINDSQEAAWCKTIEVFQDGKEQPVQMAVFPEDRHAPSLSCDIVQIRLSELQLARPRQWGICWLACQLWAQLTFDDFWSSSPSRQGTPWLNVFKALVCYRLIDPGSEWRLHREWDEQSATAEAFSQLRKIG